jgi:RNA polymerase sigma-70 factor, ECF subfamily
MSSVAWAISTDQDTNDYDAERALVERARGDPAALSQLYREHYPAIALYIHRRVGDSHEADDIVSEVFLSMVANLRRYRCRGVPFRIWLYRLATTQLSRWARRRRRWAMQQLEQQPSDDSQSPAAGELDTEMIDLVMSSLPPRLQVVLTLHYLEGMKVTEIAQVLKCRAGTVKSRLSEGRARMRERLNQRDY